MKYNRSFIKFMCLVLSLVMVTSLSGFAAAPSPSTPVIQSTIVSAAECAELAEYWIDAYYDEATTIDEIIPITDGQTITSYSVTFEKNGEPGGYIVVDSYRYVVDNVLEFFFTGTRAYMKF